MDFKQESITTIHDFGKNLDFLKTRINQLSKQSRIAVLIPALYEELQKPALLKIRDHLQQCLYVHTIVICLYAQTKEKYAEAVDFFKPLGAKVIIIWENGPRMVELLETLRNKGLDLLEVRGKGKAVWLGLGIASLEANVIALHDADINTYDDSYLPKLLFPLLEKELGIVFNKAYYARLDTSSLRLYGRVMRLFVTPLLATLTELFGYSKYLRYLSAFRYPLSGEFALTSDLALNTRIPSSWGLEIGLLAEVYRNIAQKRIAQVDLGLFDHKHQVVGQSASEGLQKMCSSILRSVLRTLTEIEPVAVSTEHIRALQVKFRREAQDLTYQYFVDATFNNLQYNRHQEEVTIELFEKVIRQSGMDYLSDGGATTQMPAWTRALAVMPNFREQLKEIALADAASIGTTNVPLQQSPS